MRALSSLVDRVRRSKWMPLLAKVVASFGVIAALGLVGTGIADGWIRTRRAAAAGSISGASSAPPATSAQASAPPEGAPAIPATASGSAPASASSTKATAPCVVEGKVVLNTATAADLDKLPGIGLSKAQRIVELRTKLGKFSRLEELYRIKGIKRRLLDKLRPLVVLDPPADCPS